MSTIQLGLLFAVTAPFILAVWVAVTHRPRAPASKAAMPEKIAGFGLTRGQFAAETLNLETEVRAAADAQDALAREHFVRLDLAIDLGATVRVDPTVLRTVLRSLIVTAIRSTRGGQVLVTARTLGSQMHIRIVDDGADADQPSREILLREPGELVALQGGSIAVEARQGKGTTVTIRLPLPGGAGMETIDSTEERALAEQEV